MGPATMRGLYLLVPLAPLAASIVVGLWGPKLGRSVSHWLCILGVAAAFVASIVIARDVQAGHVFDADVYAWLVSGDFKLAIGFLIDYLTQRMAFLNAPATTANPLSPFQLFGLPTLIHPDIDTVALVTIVVVLLTLLNSACDSFAEIYLANGGRLLGNNLRVGLYSHLQKLSLAFYSKQRTGDLLTRVTGDVAAIEEFDSVSASERIEDGKLRATLHFKVR